MPAGVDARGHGLSIRTTAGPKATASFTLHRPILWCVLLQVIMTTTPAPKEAVTAALLVIGDKILSGRTKDQNIGYVAEYLTALGMHLAEVRVVGDEETAIVDAVNALRHRPSLQAIPLAWCQSDRDSKSNRLRIWGSGVRISSGAPSVSYRFAPPIRALGNVWGNSRRSLICKRPMISAASPGEPESYTLSDLLLLHENQQAQPRTEI
jgi:hypothetical protein